MSVTASSGIVPGQAAAPSRSPHPVGLLALPGVLLVLLLLFVPAAYLLTYSFREPVPGQVLVDSAWTLQNYRDFLTDAYYYDIALRTVGLSVVATLIGVVLGFPLAYFLWNVRGRAKGALVLLVVAPLLISAVVRTYGWVILLGDSGLVNGWLLALGAIDGPMQMMYTTGAVVVGLVHVMLPFMVLSILAALERIDPALLDAAETLGAQRLTSIREIIVPLAMPGIVSGVTLFYALCMTAFVTPNLMGGTRSKVLTTLIYEEFITTFNWPYGATAAVLLLVLSFGMMYAFLRLTAGLIERAGR